MFTIVKHNTVRFMERFGKLKKTLRPGLHFYVPFMNQVTKPVELKESYKEFDHQKVITKDNVEIDVDGIFFYKIKDPEKAFYSVEDYNRAIDDLSMSVSRSEIGKTKLDDMFQHRKELNERIRHAMNQSTATWGIECLNYEVLKIEPPKKIKEALRFVAEAERLKRRDVIISEAEKTYQVAISEAERIASIIVQEGKAEAVRIKAEELAKGISEFNEKLGEGINAKTLIQYLLLENYISKYSLLLKNSNVMVLPDGTDGKIDSGLVSLAYIMKNFRGNNESSTKQNFTYNEDKTNSSNEYSALDLGEITKTSKDSSSNIEEQKAIPKTTNTDISGNKSDFDSDIHAFLNKLASKSGSQH